MQRIWRRLVGAVSVGVAALATGCAAAPPPAAGSLGATSSLYLPTGDLSVAYRYEAAAGRELDLVVEVGGSAKGAFDGVTVAVSGDGLEIVSGATGELVSASLRARHVAHLRAPEGRTQASATVTLVRAGAELARERFAFAAGKAGLRPCSAGDAACDAAP
ncbi:MAG: hypothetical protein IT373_24390 [Polyangiaceae bacterium]|nr:hypothetical protein [Polyangiaceae bacterium]